MNDVKTEALEALTSNVMSAPRAPAEDAMDEDPSEWEVPKVTSTDDFELAKAVKEKGRPTGRYEKLDGGAQLKNVVANWEPVFIQFKDPNGECPLLVVIDLAYISLHTIHCGASLLARPWWWCVRTQEDCCPSRYRCHPSSWKRRKILHSPPHARASEGPIRRNRRPRQLFLATSYTLKSCAVSLMKVYNSLADKVMSRSNGVRITMEVHLPISVV